ncbi:hypothetical protein GW764_01335 [Candidatus Parcubacteria bacterium]|nr:hypothetical protein [Candidatus Parcubacteria bacterium]
MANDIRCRNCGHTETSHYVGNEQLLGPEGVQLLKDCLEKGGYDPDPKDEKFEKLEQE